MWWGESYTEITKVIHEMTKMRENHKIRSILQLFKNFYLGKMHLRKRRKYVNRPQYYFMLRNQLKGSTLKAIAWLNLLSEAAKLFHSPHKEVEKGQITKAKHDTRESKRASTKLTNTSKVRNKHKQHNNHLHTTPEQGNSSLRLI